MKNNRFWNYTIDLRQHPAQVVSCLTSLVFKAVGLSPMIFPRLLFATCLFVALCVPQSGSLADWINLTGAETSPNIAEITVLDDRVHMAIEVYVEDIGVFEDVLPDAWFKELPVNRPPLKERMARFSGEVIQVIAEDGTRLPAELRLVERRLRKERYSPFAGMVNPMTGQKAPSPPEDKRVLYVELDYPFEGRPEHISMVPPMDDGGLPRISIGFIAYHKTVPVINFRYFSAPVRLNLDWDDPWYSRFDNPNLKRHQQSGVSTFLYVEPREVRHETLIRARDLGPFLSLGLKSDDVLDAQAQKDIKSRAAAFFAQRNPVEIDGVAVQPGGTRAEVLRLQTSGLQIVEDGEDISADAAFIGVILSFPVAEIPGEIEVTWDMFNDRIEKVPATSFDPAGPFLSGASPDDPLITWKNHLLTYQEPAVAPVLVDDSRKLLIPVLSLVLAIAGLVALYLVVRPAGASRPVWIGLVVVCAAGAVLSAQVLTVRSPNPFAGPPSEEAGAVVVQAVLDNANAAFVEKEPDARGRALAVFVDEADRGQVDEELARALVIDVAGGSTARVTSVADVSLSEVQPLDGRTGFRALAEWTANAKGSHWGHAHDRDIRYRAHLEVVDAGDDWKLAGITIVDARQLQ